jgi:predicted nucleic acid-binding protein
MKKVFVDTNIVLDVLLQNDKLWQDSIRIFQLAELGQIHAYISASSMTDIFYVASKKLTKPTARMAIEHMLDLFYIVSVGADDLRGALSLPIEDMEDALQAWCACKIGAEALITRDLGGFPGIDIPVHSPVDFYVE